MTTNLSTLTNGQFRERLRFGAYLLTLLAAVYQLPGMLARGWWSGPGNVTRAAMHAVAQVVGGLAVLEAVAAGVVVGLLAVLFFDEKKRLQALLLTAAVLGTLVVFTLIGFHPQLFVQGWIPQLGSVVVGFVLAVVVSAGRTLLTALDANHATDFEFRRAATLFTGLVSAVVGLLFVEAHVVYPALDRSVLTVLTGLSIETSNLALDTVTAGAFIVTLNRFMEYDSESTLLVLGPKGTGKTYFTVGAYLEEDYGSATTRSASRSLQELVGTVNRRIALHGGDRWHLGSTDTGETEYLSFTRQSGSLIPKNVRVESFDHAGENLAGLSDALAHDHLDVDELEPGDLPDKCDVEDVQQMADRIDDAATLVLLVDGQRLFDAPSAATDGGAVGLYGDEAVGDQEGPATAVSRVDEPPVDQLELYAPIVEAYSGEKRIVFAVTKADVLESEMRADYGLNIYDRTNLTEFGDILRSKLEDHAVARQLIRDAASSHVYPVYFRTEETEHGDRVPVRPDSGSLLIPFGYTRLLDDLS